MNLKLKKNEILVLRTCFPDYTSYRGFKWPASGFVEAPDWEPTYRCGRGLHGLPWGVGHAGYCNKQSSAIWQVVKVSTDPENYLTGKGELDDKCKFRSGTVVFSGSRTDAVALISKYAPADTRINWAVQITNQTAQQTAGYHSTQKAGSGSPQKADYRSIQQAGYSSIQQAGYNSTQTAGHDSTQTAGSDSTQTAGHDSVQTADHDSTQTAGVRSTQKAGVRSTQKAGSDSTQTAGHDSVQTADHDSTQTAGVRSTQKAGVRSTQKAGDYSVQTADHDSTQTAGLNSCQIIDYYKNYVWKRKIRLVTEKEADKPYKFDVNLEDWVEVK